MKLFFCLSALSLWFRLADIDICAAEVREEGLLEEVGFCLFAQTEKELG